LAAHARSAGGIWAARRGSRTADLGGAEAAVARPLRDAQVGELFFTILKEQFEALRDGDRFWYELVLTDAEVLELEQTRLSDIIRRNTDIADEIPDDAFEAPRSPSWT
jgi:Animal haem peroxidase